jgi:hypothetical protein
MIPNRRELLEAGRLVLRLGLRMGFKEFIEGLARDPVERPFLSESNVHSLETALAD